MKKLPNFESYQLAYVDMFKLINNKYGFWTIYEEEDDEEKIKQIIKNLNILFKYLKK